MYKKSILITLITVILNSNYLFAAGNMPDQSEWEQIRKEDVAKILNEWKSSEWIREVNTTGWEDGVYIAPDRGELYFTYINVDLLKLPKVVITGPNRDLKGVGIPPCGQFPRPDIFYSTQKNKNNWIVPIPHPVIISYPVGGFVLANENKAYFHMEKDDGLRTEIYFAEKVDDVWQKPQKVFALNSKYKDDDPHIMPNDEEIFFWSDRPALLSGNNIYYSKKTSGNWHDPVLLPAPVNSDSNDMQPFVSADNLYFTSDREGVPKIFKSVFN